MYIMQIMQGGEEFIAEYYINDIDNNNNKINNNKESRLNNNAAK